MTGRSPATNRRAAPLPRRHGGPPSLPDEGGRELANRFIAALQEAFHHLGDHGGTGSPRYAHDLRIVGLKTWLLAGLPYLDFYLERPDHVDVLRVLHARRDVPASLQVEEE